jgi:hypothetical protein
MKKIFTVTKFFLIIGILLLSSCQKEISKSNSQEVSASANNGNIPEQMRKIFVSNVDQLYAAINDAENVDTKIVMSPGTYLLSATYQKEVSLNCNIICRCKGNPVNLKK